MAEANAVKVLFVDDDPNILAGYQRSLRGHLCLETASDGAAGLKRVAENGPYAVIVSDMNMPGMNGVQFLSQAKALAPDSVRMMLTGNAELQTAVGALHEGSIFQFLLKPFPADSLRMALDAGIRQHQLIIAERDLLEKTLRGSIKVLMEILATVDPASFGRAQQLRQNIRTLAAALKIEGTWKLELAAMLSQIGLVTIPDALVQKSRFGHTLTEGEKAILGRVPEISHNLLVNIPRLEPVAETILYQSKNYDGSGFPEDTRAREAIPIGARMLRILTDLAQIESGKVSPTGAFALMQRSEGRYDPQILETARQCFGAAPTLAQAQKPSHAVSVGALCLGQTLASNIQTSDGKLLILAGHRLTETLLERIKNFQSLVGIQEPIYVEGQAV